MSNKIKQINKALTHARRFEQKIENISKTDPWVHIDMNGQPNMRLEFSFGAVREIFRSTGLDINAGDVGPNQLGDPDMLCKMLTAGLRTHHKQLMGEDAEEWTANHMAMKHRAYYQHKVMQAITATQPDLEDIEEMMAEAANVLGQEEAEQVSPLVEIVDSPISGELAD